MSDTDDTGIWFRKDPESTEVWVAQATVDQIAGAIKVIAEAATTLSSDNNAATSQLSEALKDLVDRPKPSTPRSDFLADLGRIFVNPLEEEPYLKRFKP